MATIDALTPAQQMALANFIEAHFRLRRSMHWRTTFCECARRGHFAPYAAAGDAIHLMRIVHDHGPLIVCHLTTADVRRAVYNAVASCASSC